MTTVSDRDRQATERGYAPVLSTMRDNAHPYLASWRREAINRLFGKLQRSYQPGPEPIPILLVSGSAMMSRVATAHGFNPHILRPLIEDVDPQREARLSRTPFSYCTCCFEDYVQGRCTHFDGATIAVLCDCIWFTKAEAELQWLSHGNELYSVAPRDVSTDAAYDLTGVKDCLLIKQGSNVMMFVAGNNGPYLGKPLRDKYPPCFRGVSIHVQELVGCVEILVLGIAPSFTRGYLESPREFGADDYHVVEASQEGFLLVRKGWVDGALAQLTSHSRSVEQYERVDRHVTALVSASLVGARAPPRFFSGMQLSDSPVVLARDDPAWIGKVERFLVSRYAGRSTWTDRIMRQYHLRRACDPYFAFATSVPGVVCGVGLLGLTWWGAKSCIPLYGKVQALVGSAEWPSALGSVVPPTKVVGGLDEATWAKLHKIGLNMSHPLLGLRGDMFSWVDDTTEWLSRVPFQLGSHLQFLSPIYEELSPTIGVLVQIVHVCQHGFAHNGLGYIFLRENLAVDGVQDLVVKSPATLALALSCEYTLRFWLSCGDMIREWRGERPKYGPTRMMLHALRNTVLAPLSFTILMERSGQAMGVIAAEAAKNPAAGSARTDTLVIGVLCYVVGQTREWSTVSSVAARVLLSAAAAAFSRKAGLVVAAYSTLTLLGGRNFVHFKTVRRLFSERYALNFRGDKAEAGVPMDCESLIASTPGVLLPDQVDYPRHYRDGFTLIRKTPGAPRQNVDIAPRMRGVCCAVFTGGVLYQPFWQDSTALFKSFLKRVEGAPVQAATAEAAGELATACDIVMTSVKGAALAAGESFPYVGPSYASREWVEASEEYQKKFQGRIRARWAEAVHDVLECNVKPEHLAEYLRNEAAATAKVFVKDEYGHKALGQKRAGLEHPDLVAAYYGRIIWNLDAASVVLANVCYNQAGRSLKRAMTQAPNLVYACGMTGREIGARVTGFLTKPVDDNDSSTWVLAFTNGDDNVVIFHPHIYGRLDLKSACDPWATWMKGLGRETTVHLNPLGSLSFCSSGFVPARDEAGEETLVMCPALVRAAVKALMSTAQLPYHSFGEDWVPTQRGYCLFLRRQLDVCRQYERDFGFASFACSWFTALREAIERLLADAKYTGPALPNDARDDVAAEYQFKIDSTGRSQSPFEKAHYCMWYGMSPEELDAALEEWRAALRAWEWEVTGSGLALGVVQLSLVLGGMFGRDLGDVSPDTAGHRPTEFFSGDLADQLLDGLYLTHENCPLQPNLAVVGPRSESTKRHVLTKSIGLLAKAGGVNDNFWFFGSTATGAWKLLVTKSCTITLIDPALVAKGPTVESVTLGDGSRVDVLVERICARYERGGYVLANGAHYAILDDSPCTVIYGCYVEAPTQQARIALNSQLIRDFYQNVNTMFPCRQRLVVCDQHTEWPTLKVAETMMMSPLNEKAARAAHKRSSGLFVPPHTKAGGSEVYAYTFGAAREGPMRRWWRTKDYLVYCMIKVDIVKKLKNIDRRLGVPEWVVEYDLVPSARSLTGHVLLDSLGLEGDSSAYDMTFTKPTMVNMLAMTQVRAQLHSSCDTLLRPLARGVKFRSKQVGGHARWVLPSGVAITNDGGSLLNLGEVVYCLRKVNLALGLKNAWPVDQSVVDDMDESRAEFSAY